MIPLVKEPEEDFKATGVYEYCFFKCGSTTKYWHWKTNQPVCQECAKKHKVSELRKIHPDYKCKSKKHYMGL